MDVDSLTMTALIPENAAAPIVMFDDNAALKMAIVERSGAKKLGDEWDCAGLYVLIDRYDIDGGWGVYVGKAPAGIKARISIHAQKKDHWYRAILVQRDTTHGFNSAQIGWLEGKLYDILKAAEAAKLHNKIQPGDETLAPYDRQALEMVLVSIQRLMGLLGHDTSSGDGGDDTSKPDQGKQSKHHYGITVADLLEAGLVKVGDDLLSTNGAWPATAKIASGGKIALGDTEHPSPSSAAGTVKGSAANGWDF